MKIVQNYVHSFNHFYTYHRFLSIYSLWTFSDVHPHGSVHLHNLVGDHPSCCLLQVQPQDKKSPWTLSSNISTSVNARRSARNMNACSGNVLSKKVLEYQVDHLLGGWEELRGFRLFLRSSPTLCWSKQKWCGRFCCLFLFLFLTHVVRAFSHLGRKYRVGQRKMALKDFASVDCIFGRLQKRGYFVRILPRREAITMWYLANQFSHLNQIHSKQSPSC